MNNNNFGKKGWSLIGLCGVMLYFTTATTVDGLNVTVTALANLRGFDVAFLLSMSTISGLVSVVGMFVFGLICDKIGSRITTVISLVLGGLCYIWYGHATSILQYGIALCGVSIFTNAFAWIAGGAYLSSWFPRKKGLALGFATMGNNLASATIVILLTTLSAKLGGIQWAITFIGVAMILTAIWAFFIPSHPEEAGATPDNMPIDSNNQINKGIDRKNYESTWVYKDILRTKEFWLIGLSLGIYMLVTVGVMSQLVPRMIGLGFSESKAIATMSICALIGVVGSYVWGYLDIKFSTKIATAIYGVWYVIALIFNLMSSMAFLYISIFMIGVAIGGSANWPISLTSTVFGSKNFAKTYSLINPLISIIRMLSFTVLAISLALFDSYTNAYIFFIVLLIVSIVMVLLIDDKKYSDG